MAAARSEQLLAVMERGSQVVAVVERGSQVVVVVQMPQGRGAREVAAVGLELAAASHRVASRPPRANGAGWSQAHRSPSPCAERARGCAHASRRASARPPRRRAFGEAPP